ncbi:MAG: TIGR04013 family B12-binding domain/radical SAM domain-containing protein [Crenarchaeota archaeon]|nr:TIGR04013 family B12-binding domain/radical SAM domain-containing protein [Thermoproteota archaeon]
MKKLDIIVKYADLNRFSLAYVLSIIENYAASRRHVNRIVLAKDVVREIERSDADVIVVMYSIMTPQIFEEEFLEEISNVEMLKRRKNVIMIAGGPHASGDPVGTLTKLKFDIAVLREGEVTIPRLLDSILNYDDLSNVPNIVYKYGDKIVKTFDYVPPRIIGSAPFSRTFKIYAPIEIMRGCTHACKYCQTPRISMFRIRYREIDEVRRYCEHYVKHGIKVIRFLAPNGFAYGSDGRRPRPDKIEKLLKTCKQVGDVKLVLGAFPSEVRPDFVTRDVMEVVVKYVHNRKIAIGAQSGSNRLLRYIGRGHDVECVYEAVDLCIEYGFQPCIDFIFGLPGETEEDVEKTVKVMIDLARRGCIIRGHTFMPLPGTPFENEPPGKVHPKYLEALREIERMRRLEGYWKEQEHIAEKIHKYLHSRCIT